MDCQDFSDLKLETSRLSLRSLRLGDESFIFPEVDEEITRYWIGWEPVTGIEETRQQVENSLKRSRKEVYVELLAFRKELKEFIGSCSITPLDDTDEFEINVWVKKSAQRQGYAMEMLQALIGWTRQNLDLDYIIYSVTEGNEASQAMATKLGLPLLRITEEMKRGVQKKVFDYKLVL